MLMDIQTHRHRVFDNFLSDKTPADSCWVCTQSQLSYYWSNILIIILYEVNITTDQIIV